MEAAQQARSPRGVRVMMAVTDLLPGRSRRNTPSALLLMNLSQLA